jgi:adenylate kinase
MADAGNSELARTLGIALIGPPCSGKSSVAARLVSQYQLCKLTTGDVIRAAAEDTGDVSTDPEARRYLAGVVKSGGLLPDAVVMQLLKQRLASPACRKGFVLDGFPRTESQAKDLQDVLKKSDSETEFHAVELKIEDRSTLSERMAGRLVHPGSGRTYHVSFSCFVVLNLRFWCR